MLAGERPYGVRRLWALVVNLSPKSALHRELNKDARAGWSQDTYFLAALLESYVNVHRKPGSPEFHITRPGERLEMSAEELEAFMAGWTA